MTMLAPEEMTNAQLAAWLREYSDDVMGKFWEEAARRLKSVVSMDEPHKCNRGHEHPLRMWECPDAEHGREMVSAINGISQKCEQGHRNNIALWTCPECAAPGELAGGFVHG